MKPVYAALKPIWERSFTNIADADVYKKGAVDIDFIIDENQRELGMEFNNFFLLKRTRKLVERIKNIIRKAEKSRLIIFRDGKIM